MKKIENDFYFSKYQKNKFNMFSEFLYLKDELLASFIISMIFQTDIEDAVFYISELYNSKFYEDVYCIIWKIYFDFYYITNPNLISLIEESINRDISEKSLQNIHYIIKNLFTLDKSVPIFIMNQHIKIYATNQKFTAFRGKKPKYLEDYNEKSHKIIQSLEKFNWRNLTYYISLMKDEDIDIIYLDVLKFLREKRKDIKLDISLSYKNKKHLLLSLIIINYCKDKSIQIQSSKIVIDYEKPNYNINPRKLLLENKKIEIKHDKIDVFKLVRQTLSQDKLMENYYNNWEYCCKDTPIWKERFIEHQATFNDKICFPNDDLLEEFYDKYSLEPDEQTLGTTQKSHHSLRKITANEFLAELLFNLHSSSVEIPSSLLEFFVEFQDNTTQKYII